MLLSFQHQSVKSTAIFLTSIFILCSISLILFSCNSESPERLFQRLDQEAEQYYLDKNYSKAIDTWKKLLSIRPEAKDINQKLAKSYQRCGQYQQAIDFFKEQLSRTPESVDTALNLIRIQIQIFDIAGAASTWENLKSFPANPEILTTHGDLFAAQGQFHLAIGEYKKSLALEPTNQIALARLAVILIGQQQIKGAKAIYHKLEALQPTSIDILLQMGNYWILLGEQEKGELFLRKVIEQMPEDQNLKIKLAELYRDAGQYTKAATLFQQLLHNSPNNRYYKKMVIENLLLSNQITQSEILLESLSAAESLDIDFMLLKGKYYLNAGKYGLAGCLFEQALEEEPNHPLANYFLALSYFANGHNNLGESCLIKALSLNPNFTAAELALADYYYKTEEYDISLEHVSQVQNREPENYRAILLQGNILLAIKDYDGALEAFSKAFILNSSISTPLFYLSVLCSLTDKPEQALVFLSNLLKENHEFADATLLYSQILNRLGQNDKAETYLEKTIANHPTSPYLYHIYGITLALAGKNREAVKAFKSALKFAPNMRETYLQLFDIYENNSRALEKLLVEAINKTNNFQEAVIRLASLQNANGQTEKASSTYQKAITRTPSSPLLANNLAYLYLEQQPENINEAMRLATIAFENDSNNPAFADTLGWAHYYKNNLTRAKWLLEEASSLEPDNLIIKGHLKMLQVAFDKKTSTPTGKDNYYRN